MTFRAFVSTLLIGLIAGWISGFITRRKGFNWVGALIVGVIGALLGSFLFGLLGIYATSLVGRLLFAVIGALILLYLLKLIRE